MSREDNELVEEALRGRSYGKERIRCACPFCEAEGHHDSKTSLVVVAATGKWWCYRCESYGRLDEPPNPLLVEQDTKTAERVEMEPPEGFIELDEDVANDLPPFAAAWNYLRSRKISKEAILALHMGACAEGICSKCDGTREIDGERCTFCGWGKRVIVPHLDDGAWLGWVGRILTKKPKKGQLVYRYPKGMKRTLYNAKVLEIETDEPALAFEGALDVAHFYDRAFAFFGSPTPAHIQEIKERAKRPVCIVLDGDAWEVGWALGLRLKFDGLRAGSVRLPPKKDPDEVARDWLLSEARRATR